MKDPVVHLPLEDAIAHDTDTTDCLCGPAVQPTHIDGHLAWVVTHQPLAAPERPGRNRTPKECS